MNKELNLFVLNTPSDCWEEYFIKVLKRKGLVKTSIIQKTAGESKELFLNLGSKGLDGSYKFVPVEIYDRIYAFIFEFMDMYSRVSLNYSGDYNELNIHQHLDHFNLILNYYYTLFTENQINLFIHNNSPHVGYDLVPNLLAEELGIKTLYMEQSIFPNKFYYYWKFKDYGEFTTSKKLFEHTEDISIENKFEKDIPYMKTVKKGGFDFSSFKKIGLLKNELNRHIPEYSLVRDFFKPHNRGQAYSRYKLKKKYGKNRAQLSNQIDLSNPYVYFGLHLQPEKSTSSWGGKYCDQALALEHLSSILPKGWKIYVKENPKQTYFMRNPEFFRRLERIPNLQLVSAEFNTYDLIKNSKICSTVTGTIGWEAITGGKPVIIFGWGVWYKTLPGVYSFSPSLNLEEISSERVNFNELQTKFKELTEKLAPGIILNEYYPTIYDNYNIDQNSRIVTQSLEKIIQSEF